MNKEAVFSLILTMKVLAVDVVLLMIMGMFLVYYLAEEDTLLKKAVYTLVDLPLLFPPIATGFLLLWLLRDGGLLGGFLKRFDISFVFSFWGLVLAGFVASVSLFIKPLIAAIRQFPKNVVEASYVSGKSKLWTFVFVVMPNMKKVLIVSFILSISRIFGEVGISLMIGGNIPFKTNTISIEIFSAVFNGDLETAMHLSLIMFAVSGILFIILKSLEKTVPSF
jgi:molybdate transport system permease protein